MPTMVMLDDDYNEMAVLDGDYDDDDSGKRL
jgi:hypothetical protein